MNDRRLQVLATVLGARLLQRGWVMTCAESCTGGWLAKCVTDVAGSSAWFERGWVTYGNAAKQQLLGVDEAVLSRYGAVSEQTVRAMLAGALHRSAADLGVSISGIAGPGGAVAGKPVGTVWLAWGRRDGKLSVQHRRFAGDRDAVRRAATACALRGLLALTKDWPDGGGA